MVVDLVADWQEIERLAAVRQRTKRGAGLRNKRVTRCRSELAIEVDGLIGEFAVARALGLEPALTRATSLCGDGGDQDGFWRGYSYEAKYTPYPQGRLIVNDLGGLMKCCADVFVLVTGVAEQPRHVARLAGVISQRRFVERRVLRDLGYGPCPCVEQAELSPFSAFVKAEPRRG